MQTVLIADASAAVRHWIAHALAIETENAREAGCAWDALWQLAEQSFSLVVLGANLHDVSAAQVLAMVRTAGLNVPAIVVAPFDRGRARATVSRAGSAALIDDWTDLAQLRAARDLVLAQPLPGAAAGSLPAVDPPRALRRSAAGLVLAAMAVPKL